MFILFILVRMHCFVYNYFVSNFLISSELIQVHFDDLLY